MFLAAWCFSKFSLIGPSRNSLRRKGVDLLVCPVDGPTVLQVLHKVFKHNFKCASSGSWQVMLGKELCGLVCSHWSQWRRQNGNTLIFKQSPWAGVVLNQYPSFFRTLLHCPRTKVIKYFLWDQKKAIYANKKPQTNQPTKQKPPANSISKDAIFSGGVQSRITLISAFWW